MNKSFFSVLIEFRVLTESILSDIFHLRKTYAAFIQGYKKPVKFLFSGRVQTSVLVVSSNVCSEESK